MFKSVSWKISWWLVIEIVAGSHWGCVWRSFWAVGQLSPISEMLSRFSAAWTSSVSKGFRWEYASLSLYLDWNHEVGRQVRICRSDIQGLGDNVCLSICTGCHCCIGLHLFFCSYRSCGFGHGDGLFARYLDSHVWCGWLQPSLFYCKGNSPRTTYWLPEPKRRMII